MQRAYFLQRLIHVDENGWCPDPSLIGTCTCSHEGHMELCWDFLKQSKNSLSKNCPRRTCTISWVIGTIVTMKGRTDTTEKRSNGKKALITTSFTNRSNRWIDFSYGAALSTNVVICKWQFTVTFSQNSKAFYSTFNEKPKQSLISKPGVQAAPEKSV